MGKKPQTASRSSTATPRLSHSMVDRAGQMIRRAQDAGAKDLRDAIEVASGYRADVSESLKKVTVGARQFVERESTEVVVGQRLKRLPAIARKLNREPTMRLSQMEDVGGCRAILPGAHTEVRGVLKRIRKNWEIVSFDDYVAAPKSTGYRALHVVVLRDDRRIEVQLRTPGQHEWAEAVERASATTGHALKYGEGPTDLLTYFELAAWAIDQQERDLGGADEGFMRVFENLRERVRPYWSAHR